MLVLLHGLGSNEADLFAFTPDLDPRLTVISLRAPRDFAYGGYTWFDIEWAESSVSFDSEQALESLEQLSIEVSDLQQESNVSPERTILGGFSQGAMMTLGVLLRKPELIGGALVLSGCLVRTFLANESPIEHPVFQSHGKYDEVLPVPLGREVRDLLISRGATLAYHEYVMAHEVNRACLHDARNWLTDFLEA